MYFGYMFIISVAFAAVTGTVGFLSRLARAEPGASARCSGLLRPTRRWPSPLPADAGRPLCRSLAFVRAVFSSVKLD